MIITVTKEDVEVAIAAYANQLRRYPAYTCPVFQALKRAGVPVARAGYGPVFSEVSCFHPLPRLPEEARRTTILHVDSWKSIHTPFMFEYPYEVEVEAK